MQTVFDASVGHMTKRPRMGRPKSNPMDTHEEQFRVRMTKALKAQIMEDAKALGVTAADLMRIGADIVHKTLVKEREEMARKNAEAEKDKYPKSE